MDFDFSGEQYALRDMTREVFEKECSPGRLREIWNGAERDSRLWKTLAEVGILGLLVPASSGGAGGSILDLVLVLEEAGRFAVPESLVETAAVAPLVLSTEWGSRIASGDAVAAVQPLGSPYAIDADLADVLIVVREDGVHAFERGSFDTRPVPSMDRTRRVFALNFEATPETLVTDDVASVVARGALATAAVLNGVGMRLVEMTQSYVKTRRQFDRPVGSFQAVQHKVVDMFVAVESSRPAAWYAAYSDERALPDRSVAGSIAKAVAGEAASLANTEALQCHGGIGFTWEHDLHFWLKRGKALEQAWGSAAWHRARIADRIVDA